MPSGDGVIDVPVPVSVEKPVMANEVDATIRLAMDQGYSSTQTTLQQGFAAGAVRHNNAANFIAETTQLVHQSAIQLVGAKAATNLESGMSKDVLLARSAAGQPGNAPDASK